MSVAIEAIDILTSKSDELDSILLRMDRDFGKGAVMRPSSVVEPVDVISTGSLALDIALGVGGIPRGRVTEIYGPESAGKTTIALHVIAECQRAGGTAAFIDAEHALDSAYAAKIGVNLEDLLLSQPDTGEQALDIVEALVRTGLVDCIVIDSVAALTPKAEIEGDMGDSHIGLQARLMSQAMRKLTAPIARSNTAVIFLNQLREKVGVMFGSPEVTSGGKALKFYASIRVDVRRGETIKNGTELSGSKCRVKIVKNKMAPPYRQTELDIMFNEGISRAGSILDSAIEYGIVQKTGAWLSYADVKWHGREDAKAVLTQDQSLANEIDGQVRTVAKMKGVIA